MRKWRVINNNRIQSYAQYVFLWNRELGVACKVEMPKYRWAKIDKSFSHWMPTCEEEDIPNTYPAGEKPNDAHFKDSGAMYGDDGGMILCNPLLMDEPIFLKDT